ncbi:hypothetical protein ACLB2K_041826 [Fragaria x ananassa]
MLVQRLENVCRQVRGRKGEKGREWVCIHLQCSPRIDFSGLAHTIADDAGLPCRILGSSFLQHKDNSPSSLPPCSFLSSREKGDARKEKEALEYLVGDSPVEEEKDFGGGLAAWGGRNLAEGGGEDGCGGERG